VGLDRAFGDYPRLMAGERWTENRAEESSHIARSLMALG
jgi:replicative DNA helicase